MNWPDTGKIIENGFGPGDPILTESPKRSRKPSLCGVGWCDCRTPPEHIEEAPQDGHVLIMQDPIFHPPVWDCSNDSITNISSDNCNTSMDKFRVENRQTHVFADGSTYTGDWQDRERCGHGVQVWRDGAQYEGEWHRGTAHGNGRFTHPNGDVYEGSWMLDRAHGLGTYTHKDGSMYMGNWSHDLQDGHGVEVWSDGGRYEGDYVGGLKHGVGKLSWIDGSLYEGEFRQNCIHGNGVYSWADGRRYVGQWQKNHMQGRGQFSWADGRSYVGEYADGVKHGIGMFQCADGRIFAGRWSNGELIVGGQDLAIQADELEPQQAGSCLNENTPTSNDLHHLQALPELTVSAKRFFPRTTSAKSEVVRIGTRAPGSASNLRHSLSFGELAAQKLGDPLSDALGAFPEQQSVYSRYNIAMQAVAQQHNADKRGVATWVNSER
mmetsp:Transcript_64658/g.127835  ORF Transcript_64658/g.127835 Transcript_64658/m.127835 type:complete len:437 (+) Transcript_64658:2-1312(+)